MAGRPFNLADQLRNTMVNKVLPAGGIIFAFPSVLTDGRLTCRSGVNSSHEDSPLVLVSTPRWPDLGFSGNSLACPSMFAIW